MGYVSAGVDVESAVVLTLVALAAGVVIFVRRHWRESHSGEQGKRLPLEG